MTGDGNDLSGGHSPAFGSRLSPPITGVMRMRVTGSGPGVSPVPVGPEVKEMP